jgi:hypothetical protein
MKNNIKIVLIALVVFIAACTKPKEVEEPATKASVNLVFGSKINGVLLEKNSIIYTNEAQLKFGASIIKYVLSNVTLTRNDNSTIVLPKIYIIDAFTPSMQSIQMADVPNGTYKKVSFNLGVEPGRNTNGTQEELFEAMNKGMIWTWATGYIFYKHEGKFINSQDSTKSLVYHLGSDSAYNATPISFPINLEVSGVAKYININFDASKMYNSPVIDFENISNRQSNFPQDSQWIKDMKANVQDAFTLGTIE